MESWSSMSVLCNVEVCVCVNWIHTQRCCSSGLGRGIGLHQSCWGPSSHMWGWNSGIHTCSLLRRGQIPSPNCYFFWTHPIISGLVKTRFFFFFFYVHGAFLGSSSPPPSASLILFQGRITPDAGKKNSAENKGQMRDGLEVK